VSLTASERRLRGIIGAYALHSRHDARETTSAARESFLARFERDVDPAGALPRDERQRRAKAARSAYFAQLAFRSSMARAKRRGGRA
jgi:hypothetical protein